MFKDVLQSIEGIEIYTIISMLIFIVFFIGMIIWLFKVDKKYIKDMSELPLNEENNSVSNYSGEFK
jgi:cytochrome c oxidase cbb3-type subunit IV